MSTAAAPSSSSSSSSSGESEQESLWLKLLRQSSTRATTAETTCVVVGDANAGKRSLLALLGLNGRPPASETQTETPSPSLIEMANYDFLDVEHEALVSSSKVHLWSFDDRLFSHSLELLPRGAVGSSSSGAVQKLMYVVAVDLTEGEQALLSLRKWLAMVSAHIASYHAALTDEQRQALRRSYAHYLSTARLQGTQSDALSDVDSEEMINAQIAKSALAADRFYVPIVVVGCKSDLLNLHDIAVVRSLKELQGKMRIVCLEAGAALLFSAREKEETTKNTSLLREYVLHRLYSDKIAMDLSINEKLEQTFIPSGFDTNDLIAISTGQQPTPNDDLLRWLSENSSSQTESVDQSPAPPNFVEIESEQEWLNGLQSFISTVASTGEPAASKNLLVDLLNESESDKAKAAAKSTTTTAAATVTTTRRASVRTAAAPVAGEKKDVKDFFQNLLANNPNPKK